MTLLQATAAAASSWLAMTSLSLLPPVVIALLFRVTEEQLAEAHSEDN